MPVCILPPAHQYMHQDKRITIPYFPDRGIYVFILHISVWLFLGELYNEKYQDLRLTLSNCISLIENIVSFPWGLMKKHEMRSFIFPL